MKVESKFVKTFCIFALVVAFASGGIVFSAEPVKVFILAGQSNMLGQGNMSPVTTQGTAEYIAANDPDYAFLKDGSDDWVVRDDVWIKDQDPMYGGLTVGYGSQLTTIGPELGFGHAVGDLYEKRVLIVKAAWGGKSLAVDFRPPSSGGTTGFYYNEVLRLVNDAIDNLATYVPGYNPGDENNPADGYEIAGFGWHQGWNDRVTAQFAAEYEANMVNFIKDIRVEFDVPDLPFVIATTGMDGGATYTEVELAQLAMADAIAHPEFAGNVAVIDTRQSYDGMDFWQPVEYSPADQGYHWNRNAKTYVNIGVAIADAMSRMAPSRCPSRLRAVGAASGGVTLNWQNGEDVPTSVQVLRNSVEIAAAAPASPATFTDTTALPGVFDYELIFAMAGDACGSLTVTFNGGITDLEAYRSPDGVGLAWVNNMAYDAIEISRDGTVLEASLYGSSVTYTDTKPPSSGIVTYSVVPTNGTAAATLVEINLDGPSAGKALIYEPFDYVVGGLNLQSSNSEVGLEGQWSANSTTKVTAGTLTYGELPVGGGKISDFTPSQNRFGGARGIRASALADKGLLDDGATLWFSVLMGVEAGANRTNSSLGLALAAGPFGGGNANWFISGGTGIGLRMGAGKPIAAFYPADTGSTTLGSFSGHQFNVDEYGLVVGKITWGETEDTIELYQVDTDLILPASPISTLTTTVDQSTFDTLTFRRGDKPVLDEIRFAATYDDVIGAGDLTDPWLDKVDLNGDSVVDNGDFAVLASKWQQTGCDLCNGADLTGDGNVDIDDLMIVAGKWLNDYSDRSFMGHWEMNGDASDSTLYANDGIVHGSPLWEDVEHSGGSMIFDAIDDYVEIDGYKGITGKRSRSVSAWIKTSTVFGVIISWGNHSSKGNKWIVRVNDTGSLRAEVGGGYIYGTTDLTSDDQWHHIAVVLDSDGTPDISEVKLYVDGQPESVDGVSDQAINTASDQNVTIGAYQADTAPPFDGLIDDVRVYSRALTGGEILELAEE